MSTPATKTLLAYATAILVAALVRPADASQCGFASGGGAGGYTTCALRIDGDVQCWGDPNSRLFDVPEGKYQQLSIEESNACGLRTDGSVACWSDYFNVGIPPAGEFSQVDVGHLQACGVRPDGTAECWGYDEDYVLEPPRDTFLAISVGSTLGCGILEDQTVKCWGSAGGASIETSGAYSQIDVVGRAACGIHTDGTVDCWGDIYVDIPPTTTATQVKVAGSSTCLVRSNGTIECWQYANVSYPVEGSSFVSMFGGRHEGCAVRSDTTLRCWGDDLYSEWAEPGPYISISLSSGDSFGNPDVCGVRTDGTSECWSEIPDPDVDGPFVKISTGDNAACGLHTDGTAQCWNESGLDSGLTWGATGTFVDLNVGNQHACGLRSDGSVYCWGDSPTAAEAQEPSGTFVQVDAGSRFNCGVLSGGTITCWGSSNFSGQQDAPPGSFVQVSTGATHACGRRPDGSVECWGSDFSGESSPPSGSFTQVSAGSALSCGLRGDGSVECWGSNEAGVQEEPAGPFTTVSAGEYGVCALRPGGDLVCWGWVSYSPSVPCAVCGDGTIDRVEECDDGGIVPNDGCSQQCVSDCAATPVVGCRSAAMSSIQIKTGDLPEDSSLKWKWRRGEETLASTMSDPTEDGRYNVCLYPDGAIGGEILLPQRSRWTVSMLTGFRYDDRYENAGGVSSLRLKPGLAGTASLQMKAAGANLPAVLPATSYVIQLVDTIEGSCWESNFPVGTLRPSSFRARSSN